MGDNHDLEYAWGACGYKDCPTIAVRCRWGHCKAHCEELHKDPTGVALHEARSSEEERESIPNYTPKAPRLVVTHRFLEEAA